MRMKWRPIFSLWPGSSGFAMRGATLVGKATSTKKIGKKIAKRFLLEIKNLPEAVTLYRSGKKMALIAQREWLAFYLQASITIIVLF